jgi:hypothetical protein
VQRIEVQHNTPEQVRDYLADARRMVDELQVPPELREVAFTKAIDLLAAKNIQVVAPATGVLPAMHIPRG